MNVLIVYAHRYENSFNHQILTECMEALIISKHEVDVLDLYKENFNPVMSKDELAIYKEGKYLDEKVGEYQQRIKNADYLIFITPIWWVSVPAILKGFIDKVFLKEFAFEIPKKFPKGKLNHLKGAAVFTTMSSPEIYYSMKLKNGIKQNFIKGTLKFSGIKNVKWMKLGLVDGLDKKKADNWLWKISKFIKSL